MSGAAGGGGGGASCLGAAAAAGCSSAGSVYAAPAAGGAGVAGRLPARVLEHVFSYLELSDLMRCSLVCWHWYNILADENSEVWRSLCGRSLSDEALRSDILCNLPTYKGKVGLPTHTAALSLNPIQETLLLNVASALQAAALKVSEYEANRTQYARQESINDSQVIYYRKKSKQCVM